MAGLTPLTLQLAAGWYRLEVENSRGHQSSLRVEIGKVTPGVAVASRRGLTRLPSLDKRAYLAGDKACDAGGPRPGKACCWWKMATACAGGSVSSSWGRRRCQGMPGGEFEIPVSPEWQRVMICISRPRSPRQTVTQSR